MFLLSYTRSIIAAIGATIILFSCFKAIVHFFASLLHHKSEQLTIKEIRLQLGYSIILGLEFIVAADIVESIARPGYYELGILASLVVIRTFLSYFLNKELAVLSPHEWKRLH
jgi:uncharacterized membrane protein